MDKDKLIEKYLYNELSEKEYRIFEQEVENNSDFAEEVKLSTVIFEDTRSEFKKTLKDSYQYKTSESSNSNSSRNKILYALIFVIALLVIFYIYITGIGDNTPSSTPPPPVELEKGNSTPSEEEHGTIASFVENPLLEVAYEYTLEDKKFQFKENIIINVEGYNLKDAYEKNEYENVIKKIEKIENPNSKQRFLLGLSYLYKAKYDKATQPFGSLLFDNEYKDSALWYLSIALLNDKQIEEAKGYLEDIVASSNHDKKNEAKELLKLIENNGND